MVTQMPQFDTRLFFNAIEMKFNSKISSAQQTKKYDIFAINKLYQMRDESLRCTC